MVKKKRLFSNNFIFSFYDGLLIAITLLIAINSVSLSNPILVKLFLMGSMGYATIMALSYFLTNKEHLNATPSTKPFQEIGLSPNVENALINEHHAEQEKWAEIVATTMEEPNNIYSRAVQVWLGYALSSFLLILPFLTQFLSSPLLVSFIIYTLGCIVFGVKKAKATASSIVSLLFLRLILTVAIGSLLAATIRLYFV